MSQNDVFFFHRQQKKKKKLLAEMTTNSVEEPQEPPVSATCWLSDTESNQPPHTGGPYHVKDATSLYPQHEAAYCNLPSPLAILLDNFPSISTNKENTAYNV